MIRVLGDTKGGLQMSNKNNYTQFSKSLNRDNKIQENNFETLDNLPNEEVANVVETEEVKNDTTMEEIHNEIINEVVNEKPVQDEILSGVVSGCSQLYVREQAKKESEPLAILDEGTEVTVVNSTESLDFYKIITLKGTEGYCMKKFIKIR